MTTSPGLLLYTKTLSIYTQNINTTNRWKLWLHFWEEIFLMFQSHDTKVASVHSEQCYTVTWAPLNVTVVLECDFSNTSAWETDEIDAPYEHCVLFLFCLSDPQHMSEQRWRVSLMKPDEGLMLSSDESLNAFSPSSGQAHNAEDLWL